MKPVPGTYILVLQSKKQQATKVGKLGRLLLYPGWYLYVGSAFGPGGLPARIRRHMRKSKTLRWHIDYLREKTDLTAVWYTTTRHRKECEWAEILELSQDSIAIPRFGSSDCNCLSHLFFFKSRPDFYAFSEQTDEKKQVKISRIPVDEHYL